MRVKSQAQGLGTAASKRPSDRTKLAVKKPVVQHKPLSGAAQKPAKRHLTPSQRQANINRRLRKRRRVQVKLMLRSHIIPRTRIENMARSYAPEMRWTRVARQLLGILVENEVHSILSRAKSKADLWHKDIRVRAAHVCDVVLDRLDTNNPDLVFMGKDGKPHDLLQQAKATCANEREMIRIRRYCVTGTPLRLSLVKRKIDQLMPEVPLVDATGSAVKASAKKPAVTTGTQ